MRLFFFFYSTVVFQLASLWFGSLTPFACKAYIDGSETLLNEKVDKPEIELKPVATSALAAVSVESFRSMCVINAFIILCIIITYRYIHERNSIDLLYCVVVPILAILRLVLATVTYLWSRILSSTSRCLVHSCSLCVVFAAAVATTMKHRGIRCPR
jgi:hypothetical protein